MTDLGHWSCSEDIPEECFGFIYEITNLDTGRIYIGKKQMKTKRKLAPLKGYKRRRSKIVDTDWRSYTGSCNELNEDINRLGKDKFQFKILKLCNSKWELAYEESKLQFERDVLLSENYYNGIINLRIGKPPKEVMNRGTL